MVTVSAVAGEAAGKALLLLRPGANSAAFGLALFVFGCGADVPLGETAAVAVGAAVATIAPACPVAAVSDAARFTFFFG